MSGYPIPDAAATKDLGFALRSVRYSEAAVHDLLGEDAYSRGEDEAPADERRLPESPVATVVRLFFLQRSVATDEAVRALGRNGVEALETTGLAAVGDEVVPRVRILPIGRLLVPADGYAQGDDPADYVAVYTPTSRLCDSLTPRPRIARALDVGSGSGIHALLAAAHAEHVVATDVNARALAFIELNAALNGVTNVECRRGSLFEPVAGETFDLITCNAPYVVSPESRWAYRDSGLQADEISERGVHEAAAHLTDGGFAPRRASPVGRRVRGLGRGPGPPRAAPRWAWPSLLDRGPEPRPAPPSSVPSRTQSPEERTRRSKWNRACSTSSRRSTAGRSWARSSALSPAASRSRRPMRPGWNATPFRQCVNCSSSGRSALTASLGGMLGWLVTVRQRNA